MHRRPLAAALVVLATAILGGAQAGSASTTPASHSAWTETRLTAEWVGPAAGGGSIRPRRIRTLASGPTLLDIHWTSWGLARAEGTGYVQACPGCGSEHGDAVSITVLAPREFKCGDPAQSIGHWFSRIRVHGPRGDVLYHVYQDGHPNAC